MPAPRIPADQVTVPSEIPTAILEFLLKFTLPSGWNVGEVYRTAFKHKRPVDFSEAQSFIAKLRDKALYDDRDLKVAEKLWQACQWLQAFAILSANKDYASKDGVLVSVVEYQTNAMKTSLEKFIAEDSKVYNWP